jgi:hypothetical protein
MSPDEIVAMAVNLTQSAVEHTSTFSVANEVYHTSTAKFMDIMYQKIAELSVRHSKG